MSQQPGSLYIKYTGMVTDALGLASVLAGLKGGRRLIVAFATGFEGPIRSRLVENGYLGEADPAKGVRQGSAPRAWPQQDEAEGSPYSGPPVNSNRPVVGDTGHRPLLTHDTVVNQGQGQPDLKIRSDFALLPPQLSLARGCCICSYPSICLHRQEQKHCSSHSPSLHRS